MIAPCRGGRATLGANAVTERIRPPESGTETTASLSQRWRKGKHKVCGAHHPTGQELNRTALRFARFLKNQASFGEGSQLRLDPCGQRTAGGVHHHGEVHVIALDVGGLHHAGLSELGQRAGVGRVAHAAVS